MTSYSPPHGSGNARAEILIVGGGTGGCAAAMSAASLGKRVILTEETDWIGGQLTSQAVPPDEHTWIEQFGSTGRYKQYRNLVRQYYRDHYPLTAEARADHYLNPGNGLVSRLCHEPRVALAVLEQMLAFPRAAGNLEVRLHRKPIDVDYDGDRIRGVKLLDMFSGREETIEADYVIDATELGDLLPMANVEYVTGFESQRDTGEPNAVPGDPEPDNVQALTWVFAMGHDPDGDHTIDRPAQYDFWRDYSPDLTPEWGMPLYTWDRPVFSASSFADPRRQDQSIGRRIERRVLFAHETDTPESAWFLWRRIIYPGHYPPGIAPSEVTLVIWTQNDYMKGNLIDKPEDEVQRYLEEARQQSLGFLYWMQTEAPRPDGGVGYRGLYLVPEAMGTEDGLAKSPYIRESRRIESLFTVTENHIGAEARGTPTAAYFNDTVGVGVYHIDLHFSTGGNHPIHLECLPFQIPMGSLIPVRVENLLPACKNLGVTHLVNGAFRLHPVEWNIGEAAGLLAAFCIDKGEIPKAVRENEELTREFQYLCLDQGMELDWPKLVPESGWAAFDKRVLGFLPKGALPRKEWPDE